MLLTNEDKLEASIAMCQGDTFRRGNVILFPLTANTAYRRPLDR